MGGQYGFYCFVENKSKICVQDRNKKDKKEKRLDSKVIVHKNQKLICETVIKIFKPKIFACKYRNIVLI